MTIETVKTLLARGWKLFPVVSGFKFPACPHGFLDATDDPAQIGAWFGRGNKNIGLATGDASGVVVIDFDSYKEGQESALQGLMDKLGNLPPTFTVKTRAGGWHLYFKKPEGYDLRSYNNVIAKGVDLRANGGYVLTEGCYVKADKYGPEGEYTVSRDLPIAELPKDWADAWQALNKPHDEAVAKKAARAAAKAAKESAAQANLLE